MRLIDADAFFDNLDAYSDKNKLQKMLDRQPTAYDIEKVVAELEEQAEQYRRRGFEHEQKGYSAMADKYYGKQCSYLHSIEIVNELAEEHNNGWIPCSERLPEANQKVLTCDKDGWISVNVNMPYIGVRNDFECGYYVAWQPLPQPYKENENGKI